jgi:pyridoxine kinase
LTCCPSHAANLLSIYTDSPCVPGNHTGYGQFKGTKATAQEIRDIYDGLCQSNLTDFDMLLSGYLPSAETVEAVGVIARDLRFKATNKPGSFFWGVSRLLLLSPP